MAKSKSFQPRERGGWIMDVEMDGVQERVRVRGRKLWDHVLWRELAYLQLPPFS